MTVYNGDSTFSIEPRWFIKRLRMKGARKLPQLNFRWPEKDIELVKQWAEKNGRSLNDEVHRIVMEYLKDKTVTNE